MNRECRGIYNADSFIQTSKHKRWQDALTGLWFQQRKLQFPHPLYSSTWGAFWLHGRDKVRVMKCQWDTQKLMSVLFVRLIFFCCAACNSDITFSMMKDVTLQNKKKKTVFCAFWYFLYACLLSLCVDILKFTSNVWFCWCFRVHPAMYNNLDASQDISLMSHFSSSDTQQEWVTVVNHLTRFPGSLQVFTSTYKLNLPRKALEVLIFASQSLQV